MSTKQVVPGLRAELVIAQFVLARQQSECAGLDDYVPVPCFRADRAVTPICSEAQVDVGLKSNRAATAAANKRFDHHNLPGGCRLKSVQALTATLCPAAVVKRSPKQPWASAGSTRCRDASPPFVFVMYRSNRQKPSCWSPRGRSDRQPRMRFSAGAALNWFQ